MGSLNKKNIIYIAAAAAVVVAAVIVTVVIIHLHTKPAPTVSEVVVNGSTVVSGQAASGQVAQPGTVAAGGSAAQQGNTVAANGKTAVSTKTSASAAKSPTTAAKPHLSQAGKDTSNIDTIIAKKPNQIVYVKNGVSKTLNPNDKEFTYIYRSNDIRIRETMFDRTGKTMTKLATSPAASAVSGVSPGYVELQYKYPTRTLYFPLTRDASGYSVMAMSSTKAYPADEFKFLCPPVLTKRLLAHIAGLS